MSLLAAKTSTLMAAGLVTGVAAGSAVVASGVLWPVATPAPTVALYACPDGARVVEQVPSGQTLLVTAQSADGGWLQVYLPDPANDRAWAHADALHVDGDVASLPVASCDAGAAGSSVPQGETGLVSVAQPTGPSPSPSPSPSPEEGSPSPSPSVVTPPPPSVVTPPPPSVVTPPPPSVVTPPPSVVTPPPPVPPPSDGDPPTLSALSATPTEIWSGDAGCGGATTTVTVNATDGSGVAMVTLWFVPPGQGSQSKAMTLASGSQWRGTITAASGWAEGTLQYWVEAADVHGNRGTTARQSVTVSRCDRTGPTLSNLAASEPLIWGGDPNCGPQASRVTVRVTDPSGVWVVGLAYTPPGRAEVQQLMDPAGSGIWTYTITTNGWPVLTGRVDVDYYAFAWDLRGNQSSDLHAANPIQYSYCLQ